MSKGSRNRTTNHAAYRRTMDRIKRNERAERRRKEAERQRIASFTYMVEVSTATPPGDLRDPAEEEGGTLRNE